MAPKVVLVKFNINPKWDERFRQAGIPVKSPDENALELAHILHAVEMGRNPYQYRQVADSGVPAFGKEGEQNVSINGLLAELRSEGYSPVGIHIRTRTRADNKFNVLVMPFILMPEGNGNGVVPPILDNFLKVSCWGFVHVWMNPPQEDGTIVHTVNLSHREERAPEKNLRFKKGRWHTIPIH